MPTKEANDEVERLNHTMPVGTRVMYYPGPRAMGGRECSIRREFGVDPYTGHVFGWVTGTAGYVLASRIDALPAEQPVGRGWVVSDFDYHDMDIDLPACEKCGKPLTGDSDGDGVWATPVYFCEHCPDEDAPTLHAGQEVVKEVPRE